MPAPAEPYIALGVETVVALLVSTVTNIPTMFLHRGRIEQIPCSALLPQVYIIAINICKHHRDLRGPSSEHAFTLTTQVANYTETVKDESGLALKSQIKQLRCIVSGRPGLPY
ncbi:unnamed protein product [Protopolystoma xenopodis]|uniref:Uncharacterized protein n=1 Tax=Protopolystoma xenopodis TaxID=117903 RepID=A0A448WCQ4_9PLAT|nr:unnamed protein product [Protopolystoma xenopodis]